MLPSWKPLAVGLLSYWVWSRQHLLFPRTLPALFDTGAGCEIVGHKHPDSKFKFCEDGVVVVPGIAVFSCDPGRRKWNTVMGPMTDPNPRGGLWAIHYDTDTVTEEPYALELSGFPSGADFHPLGIEVTPDSELLVINHRRERPTIEVFRIQSNPLRLVHEKTLDHPSITSPNAISALSGRAFYVSQDHAFSHRIGKPLNLILPLLETLLALPLGRVELVRWDADRGINEIRTVASGIPFANGLALSEDGSTLAVASTSRSQIWFYSTNETNIDYVRAVNVPFSVDNIAFAGDTLLATGHPNLLGFMAVKTGKSEIAPSWVSSVRPVYDQAETWISRAARGVDVLDVFKSDGSFFTSSSGAFADVRTSTMFVVGLYDPNGVARCRLGRA